MMSRDLVALRCGVAGCAVIGAPIAVGRDRDPTSFALFRLFGFHGGVSVSRSVQFGLPGDVPIPGRLILAAAA